MGPVRLHALGCASFCMRSRHYAHTLAVMDRMAKQDKQTRRANGEGGFVQLKDGRWRFTLRQGRDPGGKPKRLWLTADTLPELRRKVADETAKAGGDLRKRAKPNRLTLGAWMTTWLGEIKQNRSISTYNLYEGIWRVHAEPLISNVKFDDLDASVVEHLYRALQKKKLPTQTIQRVGRVCGSAVNVAIRRGHCRGANPFTLVEKPRHDARRARTLSRAEAQRFLDAANEDRFAALWTLLLTTGMRLGEALALRWEAVDLKARTLAIYASLEDVGGVLRVKEPKTRRSQRLVDLGDRAVVALGAHRKVSAYAEPTDFVFCTADGKAMRRSNLYRSHFGPLCERAKIDGLTVHGLRHTWTTLALSEGEPVHVVAGVLGHSTPRLTLDRYAHVIRGAGRHVASTVDRALKAKRRKGAQMVAQMVAQDQPKRAAQRARPKKKAR